MWKALWIPAAIVFLAVLAGPGRSQTTRPGNGSAPTDVDAGHRPRRIDFGPRRSDQIGAVRSYTFTNHSSTFLFLRSVEVVGPDAGGFRVLQAPQLSSGLFGARPGIPPGKSRRLSVAFEPDRLGLFEAELVLQASRPLPFGGDRIGLEGVALGPLGDELHVNAGGFAYVDSGGREWAREYDFRDGRGRTRSVPVSNTPDESLLQSQRTGPSFSYAFELPQPGAYGVTLHLAELEHLVAGARVFDVYADGVRVITDLDVFALAGARAATSLTFVGRAQDTTLDLDFVASVGEATVAAIEVVSRPLLEATPPEAALGAVAQGEESQQILQISNSGSQGLVLESLALRLGASGTAASFSVELAGQTLLGGTQDVSLDLDLAMPPGSVYPLTVTFRPLTEQYDIARLELLHGGGVLELELSGLGGHEGDPYLHAVIEGETLVVDRDADGAEWVVLDGTSSHTHEPGHALSAYRWSADGIAAGTGPTLNTLLGRGTHALTLEIEDDNTPPRTLTLETDVHVLGTDEVIGVLALYYPAAPGAAGSLLDAPPANAEFGEVVPGFDLTGPASIGASPYTTDVMVRLRGELMLKVAAQLELIASGGSDRRLLLEGQQVSGPVMLTPGRHAIDARFAVDDLTDLPLEVLVRLGSGQTFDIPTSLLSHDESALVPVISSMQDRGTTLGGNAIVISGLGFFPSDTVTLHWGAQDLTASDFTQLTAESIRFDSPPGPEGTIAVSVETGRGVSNVRSFEYDASGPVPILFANRATVTIPSPTAGAWGPDGRLYVAGLDGQLSAIEFADDWTAISTSTYPGVSALTNSDTLGLAFDPYDSASPGPVRVYLSHGQHFLNGGSSFSGSSDYTGQVSLLTGPAFDTPVPILTGLPTSNHDHGMNGILFDNNGDLLIAVGSNTNAGVRHPNSGDLPESPLSSALVLAQTSHPDFDGSVTYVETTGGAPNADQVFGEEVDLVPGLRVWPYAVGLRNAYDVILAASGRLYATDNGPNFGFGGASTGPATQVGDPQDIDEVLLIEYGGYYGHPNRSRGRYDARENVYHSTTAAEVPGEFTQALVSVPSSTNGLLEYRADTFAGQMRGDLITQKWGTYMRRIELSDDGRSVLSVSTIYPWTGALDLLTGPGGALLGLDYTGSRVRVAGPNDQAAVGLVVYDILPWRAPATGGSEFVIGGVGFGNLGNTSVSIGGRAATLLSVSATRIRGLVPSTPTATTELLDVIVTSGGQTDTHLRAFRYLLGPGLEPGAWQAEGSLPVPLGEVSAAVIGGVLYLVGEGSSSTYAYDLVGQAWLPERATRPYPGHHHGSQVFEGRWYLVGGLGGGAEGRVQIYDPATDTWSTGSDMSWAGGSVSTALIGGMIYASGGIVGTTTVDNCARYNPATDLWSVRARMPAGRNHAASASDGTRMYVFGGRTGGNWVANGYADVQIYDPQTDSWSSTTQPGSTLAPLPQARGGMGNAVFYRGEFYVFGGETASGAGAVAGNVYDRVDVYDPLANTWRLEAPMPVARHGIAPVRFGPGIYLPGGGTTAAYSQSTAFDLFRRP